MFKKCLIFCALFGVSLATVCDNIDGGLQKTLKDSFRKVLDHGYRREDHSEEVLRYFDALRKADFFPDRKKKVDHPDSFDTKLDITVECLLCDSLGCLIFGSVFDPNVSVEMIQDEVAQLCIELEIEKEPVCRGIVKVYGPYLDFVLNHLGPEAADPALFCGLAWDFECLTPEAESAAGSWQVDIPNNEKPPYVEPAMPEPGSKTIKVLHMTDIHLDLSYKPGTHKDCGMPMCCMDWTDMAETPEEGASYWGDIAECDLPIWTFDAMMKNIGEMHADDLDYVMFTGDAPAHDVWMQSEAQNWKHSEELLKSYKANLPNTQFYMTIGNHEGFPVNSFPTSDFAGSEFSGEWLYESLGAYNADYLPQDALDTFNANGFYAVRPFPGFKLINVNNNFGAGMNLLSYFNFDDPAKQLAWLANELQDSEDKGEKVHIMTHHPNQSPLAPAWSREYARIVQRYDNIIMATFVGHTHKDNFQILLNEEGTPNGITHIGPSLVPRGDKAPMYIIYTFDGGYEGASYQLLDYEAYYTNVMDYTDENDPPKFSLFYKASEALGMERFLPSDYLDLLQRAMTDDALFDKLILYYSQGINPEEYDGVDRRNFLCDKINRRPMGGECPL